MKSNKSIFGASRDQLYCACAGTVYHADTERSCDGKPEKRNYECRCAEFWTTCTSYFEETGGNQRKVLDDVGKSFVLRKIAGDCEAELRVLGSNLKKTGYIGEVKSVISEFTQYDIQEETLEQMIEEVKDSSNLYYKLQDIKTIYHGFREYLRENILQGKNF